MPVVTSKRYQSQRVGMGEAVVEFDENGIAQRIVQRMNDVVDEPIDDGVVAQARGLPDHFTIIEDDQAEPNLALLATEARREAEARAIERAACAAEGCPEAAPEPPVTGSELARMKKAHLLELAELYGVEVAEDQRNDDIRDAIRAAFPEE